MPLYVDKKVARGRSEMNVAYFRQSTAGGWAQIYTGYRDILLFCFSGILDLFIYLFIEV